jgi:hypothetical protein
MLVMVVPSRVLGSWALVPTRVSVLIMRIMVVSSAGR